MLRTQKTKTAVLKPTAPGVGTCWLDKAVVFAYGDGRLLINGQTLMPHNSAILGIAHAPNLGLIITCGGDGVVAATNYAGQTTQLFCAPNAWLDVIICHPNSQRVAVSAGREVIIIAIDKPGTPIARLKPARAPTSLSFSGDGTMLAIGHSGGVSLFKLTQPDAPLHEFPCGGGPVSVLLDQGGDYLFAGLSEPALAGWRLVDGQGFRMGGYPGKPRQLVWNHNERVLLTTGGPALLVWPMIAKDGRTRVGPMGQAAGVFRPRLGMVTAVATHGELAVVGWADGGVDLVSMLDATSRHIGGTRPNKTLDSDPRAATTNIVSVAFRDDGKQVSWIGETGIYGTAAIQ